MHARAAWQLDRLGYRVYRYAPGKADWRAAGLPTEGSATGELRAGSVARSGVPTCRPHTPVSEATAAVQAGGWDECLVLNEEEIVLGRLRGAQLDSTSQEPAEAVMELGPTTTRADDDLAGLVERMQRRNVGSILVSDPDGRLIGVLYREDAEAALSGS